MGRIIVTVLIPKRALDPSQIHEVYRKVGCCSNAHQNDSKATAAAEPLPTVIRIHRSRVLWRCLAPCLLQADRRTARKLLFFLLRTTNDWSEVKRQAAVKSQKYYYSTTTTNDPTLTERPLKSLISRRRLRVAVNDDQEAPASIILWIQPPDSSLLEDAFMGRLIAWEHEWIQAQSLTGYVATLGGGFFLCHHFQTAIVLAQQQQQLALRLNDRSMYLKCILNSAYNYIYAGHFHVANQLIKQVYQQAKDHLFPPDPVLIPMCYSARLFSKRMKRATRHLLPRNNNNNDSSNEKVANSTAMVASKDDDNSDRLAARPPSKTVDDYARIRVARDQSRQDDLVIPFGRSCKIGQ